MVVGSTWIDAAAIVDFNRSAINLQDALGGILRIQAAHRHTANCHAGRVVISLPAVADQRSNGQYGRDNEQKNRCPPQENIGVAISHWASLNSPEMNTDKHRFWDKKTDKEAFKTLYLRSSPFISG